MRAFSFTTTISSVDSKGFSKSENLLSFKESHESSDLRLLVRAIEACRSPNKFNFAKCILTLVSGLSLYKGETI